MSDPFIGLALKFVEQGGLYVLFGLFVLLLGVAVWGFRTLWKSLEECIDRTNKAQEARVADMREISDKTIKAIESQRLANESATRAAEANGRLTEAQGTTINALKGAIETLTKAAFDARGRKP